MKILILMILLCMELFSWDFKYQELSSKITLQGENLNKEISDRKEADAAINARIDDLWDKLNAHIQDKNNPHNVTREQLGVGESDEVTFSKVTANGFFMSVGSAGKRICGSLG